MRIIIVGCGSMGKRRARCLRKLGLDQIKGVDPRPDRRVEIEQQSKVQTFATFEEALREGAGFVLLCVAPHLHAGYLMQCIQAGHPVFCEAPLTLTLEEAEAVIEAAEHHHVFIAPSCTYLHNRIHLTIKEWLDSERFGRPLAAFSHVGQHVADWHPYEDYRSFYASKRSEGGMCLDMLPHDLHLFRWYFGEVKALTCMARRRSTGIETDPAACDVYDVLLDTDAGVSLMLHQDMFQRPGGVYRKIMCERGAIEWNWRELRICEYTGPEFPQSPAWQNVLPEYYDFEDMYVAELAHVFQSYEGKAPYLMPPRQERRILEIVLACEESSFSGTTMIWKS
ncbi:MAG TPA: Gfo/Idh/MocA family oxidoreductase [Candidatus Hydrogenedentes bacterium]|nr:Gfo/Idh/MocA family oxidoreductase [Candidatus Hydrogenedentota bacterium]